MLYIDCPNCQRDCGKEISSGITVCPRCGMSLRSEQVQYQVNTERSIDTDYSNMNQAPYQNEPYLRTVEHGVSQAAAEHNSNVVKVFTIVAVVAVVGVFLSVAFLMFSLNLTMRTTYTVGESLIERECSYHKDTDLCTSGDSVFFDADTFYAMVWDKDFMGQYRSYDYWDEVTDILMAHHECLDEFIVDTGGFEYWNEIYMLYSGIEVYEFAWPD